MAPPPLAYAPPVDLEAARQAFIRETDAQAEDHSATAAAAAVWVVVSAVSLVLIPRVKRYAALRSAYRQMARLARDAASFARAAVPVVGYPLMVNGMLRRPGRRPATGLVMIAFRPHPNDPGEMFDIARSVASGIADDPGEARFLRELMADEEYTPNRRRRIPPGVARGRELYACDTSISPLFLRDGHVSDTHPLIYCIAEPGEGGRIMQLPIRFAGPSVPAEEYKDHLDALIYMAVRGDEVIAGRHAGTEPEA